MKPQDDLLRFSRACEEWQQAALDADYIYRWSWLGRPIIQYPHDTVALQQIVWATKPDLIIETGFAHGGSAVLCASLLAMLDLADARETGGSVDPARPARRLVSLEIELREHNREALDSHPLRDYIQVIEGSSIEADTVNAVTEMAASYKRVMLLLDSNHTHDHVLAELRAYAGLVTPGCYCIVYDTAIDSFDPSYFEDRPWGPGNSPLSAVKSYLADSPGWHVDDELVERIGITVAPHGFLLRTE